MDAAVSPGVILDESEPCCEHGAYTEWASESLTHHFAVKSNQLSC